VPGVRGEQRRAATAGVGGRVQYGPNAHAHAADLTCANYVPVRRAARLLGSMLGLEVSVEFVAGARGKAAARLEPFMARVRQLFTTGPWLPPAIAPGAG